MLAELLPWVVVAGPPLVLLVLLQSGSRLSEMLPWAAALALGAFCG